MNRMTHGPTSLHTAQRNLMQFNGNGGLRVASCVGINSINICGRTAGGLSGTGARHSDAITTADMPTV